MSDTSQFPPLNIPRPDPSEITTREIVRLRTELREDYVSRFLALRELLDAISSANKEIIETRLSGMDKTHGLLQAEVQRVIKNTSQEADRLETLFQEKLSSVGIRFESIQTQFLERDTRARDSETAMKESAAAQALSGTTAVNAALQAQKESAFATQQSNKEAISKSEAGFQERIKALETLIDATKDGLTSSISDLRSRLDRGDGKETGSHRAVTEEHANTTNIIGIIGGVVGVLALVAMILFNMVNSHSQPPAIAVPISPPIIQGPR